MNVITIGLFVAAILSVVAGFGNIMAFRAVPKASNVFLAAMHFLIAIILGVAAFKFGHFI